MRNRYPVKQDLNLAQRDRSHRRKITSIALLVLALAAIIALFCKFAVIDRLQAAKDAEAAAVAAEERLAQIKETTAGYDELLERYNITMETREAVEYAIDPLDCLALLETHFVHAAHVSACYVGEDIISVQFSGLTLGEISVIYSNLMEHELVKSVQVFTASTDKNTSVSGDEVTATMTIHLTPEKGDESAS